MTEGDTDVDADKEEEGDKEELLEGDSDAVAELLGLWLLDDDCDGDIVGVSERDGDRVTLGLEDGIPMVPRKL